MALRTEAPWKSPALLCAALLGLCVLLALPFAEMGINDDWSYIYSARVLAQTGHVVYNGWAAAMEGWLLLLSAAFVKVFGFSYTVTRVPVLLSGMLTAALLQRCLVRMDVNEWNAGIGTLTVVLSPLFLPLTSTMMTDIPGLFCLVLCLYLCLRALQSADDTTARNWLIVAGLSNLLAGTVRQIGWLGVLVLVPSTAILMRRRRGALVTAAVLFLLGLVVAFGCMRWFAAQPYSVPEKLIEGSITASALPQIGSMFRYITLATTLYLFPVLAGFALCFPFCKKVGAALLLGGGALLVLFFALQHRLQHDLNPWIAPYFGYYAGNIVSARGLVDSDAIEGSRPAIFHLGSRLVITALDAFLCLCFALSVSVPAIYRERKRSLDSTLDWRTALSLVGPLAIVYLLLLVPRGALHNNNGNIYDRYLVPIIALLMAPLLLLFQQRVATRMPALSLAVLATTTVFSIAGTHDVFAFQRARLAAIAELRSTGIPRTELRGGWDYDGWTEIEAAGYVNEPRMVNPPGAYRPGVDNGKSTGCPNRFARWTPDIHPRFGVSWNPRSCLGPAPFAPVSFRTWLPPFRQTIYLVRMQ